MIAGTEEWCALADDDPRKTTALLIAGSRWCLEQELQHLDDQRRAFKDAALAVAESKDWKTVAQRIRSRDSYYREHPDLKRKKVS
nr:hypothetical protein ISGA_12910 [Gordonia sp. NB41Y]